MRPRDSTVKELRSPERIDCQEQFPLFESAVAELWRVPSYAELGMNPSRCLANGI